MENKVICLILFGLALSHYLNTDQFFSVGGCGEYPIGISYKLQNQELDSSSNLLELNLVSSDLKLIQHQLNRTQPPFASLNRVLMEFLGRVSDKNERSLIRNGNLLAAMTAVRENEILLDSFQSFCDSLRITRLTTRQEFDSVWADLSRKERNQSWRSLVSLKQKLKKSARTSKKQLKLMLKTEMAILLQERHFPELAHRMNALQNLNGAKLPTYIFFHPNLTQNLAGKAGLSIICLHQGMFTTDSPSSRHFFPSLPGIKEGLTVHLTGQPSGHVLSHEFGHLYYLQDHWVEYQQFMKSLGRDYVLGGHGPDDPSGIAAELAEGGILSD